MPSPSEVLRAPGRGRKNCASNCSGEGVCANARRESREHRIRLYTATRLAELCAAAGLLVERAFDGWSDHPLGRRSSEMVLIARKVTGTLSGE